MVRGKMVEMKDLRAHLAGLVPDARKTAVLATGGIKIYPTQGVFIGFEARYVSLKVKPYDATVDLGGWRFSVGAGIALDFR